MSGDQRGVVVEDISQAAVAEVYEVSIRKSDGAVSKVTDVKLKVTARLFLHGPLKDMLQ